MTQETEDVVEMIHDLRDPLLQLAYHYRERISETLIELNNRAFECQSQSARIAELEGLLVKYGDRVRMATAWPESVQPAIDEAFENERLRSSLTKDSTSGGRDAD